MASSNSNGVLRPGKTVTDADRKRFSLLLVILLLAQPFLDNYYLYTDEIAAYTHGITLPPILVVLFVGLLTLFYIIRYRGGRSGKVLLWYLVVCAVYFVLHHLNCVDFTSFVKGDFHYSITHEAYYVARLVTPMLLIYLTWELRFDSKDFLNASCLMGAICGAAIVVTNLTGIALCAYTNEPVYGSILQWSTILTTEELLPKYFASKAFFSYANQISVVLAGLFPLLCYKMAKSPKWYNALNIIVMIFAMLMIGTMTASIGVILELCVLAVVLVLYLLYNRKTVKAYKKNIIAVILVGAVVIGILGVLTPMSPSVRNMSLDQKNNLSNKMEGHFDLDMSGSEELSENQYKEYCEFILYNYEAAGIAWRFVYRYYPYEKDPAFWVAMIRNYTVGDNQNYRSLETRVIQRITEVDGSRWNKWLGISATRETNIVKIERDILAQYYSMGILGVIVFFGVYFAVMLIGIVSILYSMFKRRKFPLFQTLLTMSFCVMMALGYYCGNSLDMTFLSTYLGVSAGVLLTVTFRQSGAEAGTFSKGMYYLKKRGLRQTLALTREYKADRRHTENCAKTAKELYPRQKAAVAESLAGKTVVVYTPTVEWHYLYQRCHQMASAIAARDGYAVVFLTSQRHYDDEKGMTQVKPDLWLVNACLADKLDELTAGAKTVVSAVYNITTGLESLRLYHSDKVVYEYVDDLRFIVSGASDFDAYSKLHTGLVQSADLTVATAQRLYDQVKDEAKNAILLPNAGDYAFFSKPAQPDPELKKKLSGYKCVLEYYGALASWFDYQTVKISAKAHPDWAWVLIGKVIGEDMAISGVSELPNVIHMPAVPYEKLPAYIACADIMTIPFVINETTLATSPVKLFEYMAAHKPILTSDLPECRGYDSVYCYGESRELDQLVPELLKKRKDNLYIDTLDAEARENTWDARLDDILGKLGV